LDQQNGITSGQKINMKQLERTNIEQEGIISALQRMTSALNATADGQQHALREVSEVLTSMIAEREQGGQTSC
jgi:hypothetical protein